MTYVIHNVHSSNFANAMIKYMAATRIQSEITGGVLSNYYLPWWDIDISSIEACEELTAECRDENVIPMNWLKYAVDGGVKRINMHGHTQRLDNFPSWEASNKLFRAPPNSHVKVDENAFLCPVRGGEILKAIHPGYTLLPIKFYLEIQERYQKPLIFMGQLGDNPYADALRRAFPDAQYLPHVSPINDYQTIRMARNVVVPISTFAWLASWMSCAEKIVLPIFGLFNTERFPGHDLLPIFDKRYDFFKFNVQDAVDVEFVLDAHKALNWSRVENPITLHKI